MLYLNDFYAGDVLTDAIHPTKFMKFVCKRTNKDIHVFVECEVREGERQFRWWWNEPWLSIPDNKIFDTGVSTDFKHTEFLESFYGFNFSSSAFGGFDSYKSKDAVRGTAQRGIIPKNSYIWYCEEHYLSDRLIVNFNKESTMSLDEAIKHCEEKSCSNNACALEHKQLAEWLKELKELKEFKNLVCYINNKRNEINFYYNSREVSWNEIPLEVRKHDYPYYFKDDLDCYPLKIKL